MRNAHLKHPRPTFDFFVSLGDIVISPYNLPADQPHYLWLILQFNDLPIFFTLECVPESSVKNIQHK